MPDEIPASRPDSVRLSITCDECEADQDFRARMKSIFGYVERNWERLLIAEQPIDTDAMS